VSRRYVTQTLRVLLPCKCNILLKCTQQTEIRNTGVHVMPKAAQTTTSHHTLESTYFRSAELILSLLDHVTIEKAEMPNKLFSMQETFSCPSHTIPIAYQAINPLNTI